MKALALLILSSSAYFLGGCSAEPEAIGSSLEEHELVTPPEEENDHAAPPQGDGSPSTVGACVTPVEEQPSLTGLFEWSQYWYDVPVEDFAQIVRRHTTDQPHYSFFNPDQETYIDAIEARLTPVGTRDAVAETLVLRTLHVEQALDEVDTRSVWIGVRPLPEDASVVLVEAMVIGYDNGHVEFLGNCAHGLYTEPLRILAQAERMSETHLFLRLQSDG